MFFRGASAGASAHLVDALRERVEAGADAGRVGRDLFAVADVLRSEPGLRRVATDVSLDPEAKSGLVDQLFGEQIDEHAMALVTTAVRQRWTSSRDLGDALEHTGVVAVVRSADAPERLEDELFSIEQTLMHALELRDALTDTSRSLEDKRSLVRGLLEDKALPATVTLVEQALAGTYRAVGVALQAYQLLAADVLDERLATVRVAEELSDDDRQRLIGALSRQYGRDVHLNVVIDAQVLGGVRVEIGDEVIDGTVSSRLDEARRRIAG